MSTFYKVLFIALISCGLFTTTNAAISHTGNPTTVGCADIFTTSISGTNYQWNFGPNSYPRTLSGSSFKTASTAFLSPGSHTIRVLITTGGGVVGDSVTITVVPGSNSVTVTTNKPVCQAVNSAVTFNASPTTYASYAFFVNDSLRQLTNSSAFTYSVVTGDSIRVFGFDGTCYTNGVTLYDHTPEPPLVTATINNADTICANTSVTFTASPVAAGDSFLFYVGGSLQQGSTSNTWTTTTLGNNNIIIAFVYNQYGCRNYFFSNSDTVYVKPTPVVNLTANDSAVCAGTQVTFTATTTQAPANIYTFSVNNTVVQSTPSNTYTTSLLHNNDTVTVTGTLNGCTSKPDTIIMTIFTSPTLDITSNPTDTACTGSPVVFTAAPDGFTNYQFFNNGTLVQNGTSSTYTVDTLTNGNHLYVRASNPGCTITPSDTISLVIIPGQTVNAGDDGTACTNGTPITLTGTNPAGGLWSGAGITDSTGVFDPAVAGSGIHVLTYAYTNTTTGCIGRGTVTYVVSAFPLINIGHEVEICDDSVVLSVSGAGLTTFWSPDFGLSCTECASTTASPGVSTTYTVRITSTATGCSNTDTVRVIANDLALTPAYTDTSIAAGDSVTLVVTATGGLGGITYNWTPTDHLSATDINSPVASPTEETSYTIYARSGGCIDSATINIHVEQPDTATRIPSAFTPNGDGHNDLFAPVFKDKTNSAVIKAFHVYNRYGQLVHDGAIGWDGRFKGTDQPTGTYVYYMAVQFPNQPEMHYQGSVTLIR